MDGLSAPCLAALVSFGPADGYGFTGASVTGDVTYYSAGAGPVLAAGPLPYILPDTGQWKLLSGVGGYFANAADRAAMAAAYNLNGPGTYTPMLINNLTFVPPNAVAAYVVGNHPGGRTGGSSLAMRNDTLLGTGQMKYRYDLQTADFGVAPASLTSGLISTEFYFCPNPAGAPAGLGVLNKFAMSFVDNSTTAGLVGLEFGYSYNNTVQWRASGSGVWNNTAQVADASNWDGVRVNIDLVNDMFWIDYFDVSASTPQWNPLVAATATGGSLANLTRLDWTLQDGVSSGVGGKNFFDDFRFTTQSVPEPHSLVLALLALAAVGANSRRPKRTIGRVAVA